MDRGQPETGKARQKTVRQPSVSDSDKLPGLLHTVRALAGNPSVPACPPYDMEPFVSLEQHNCSSGRGRVNASFISLCSKDGAK